MRFFTPLHRDNPFVFAYRWRIFRKGGMPICGMSSSLFATTAEDLLAVGNPSWDNLCENITAKLRCFHVPPNTLMKRFPRRVADRSESLLVSATAAIRCGIARDWSSVIYLSGNSGNRCLWATNHKTGPGARLFILDDRRKKLYSPRCWRWFFWLLKAKAYLTRSPFIPTVPRLRDEVAEESARRRERMRFSKPSLI